MIEYETQRKGRVLARDGHEYILFTGRGRDGIEVWRCRQHIKFKCNATIRTNKDKEVTQASGEHTHEGDPLRPKKNELLSKLKGAASSGNTTKVVLGEQLLDVSNDVLSRLPKKSSMERLVRLERSRKNSPHPNPPDIHFRIPEEFMEMVLHDSGQEDINRIIIIGSNDLVPQLDGDTIFCDGTFDRVATCFFQLYTIHTKVGNSFPPCIYALLPNKTEATYSRMITMIKMIRPEFSPTKVLIDFELAAINAFKNAFPDTNVSGCFFHLNQAIVRKVNSLGLKRKYETEVEFSLLVKSIPSLAFVPQDEVVERFEDLAGLFEDEPSVNDFLTYFKNNYIEAPVLRRNQTREPRFPIRLWNHFNDGLGCHQKTTNCAEGYHNGLKSLFLSPNPTVWTFLAGLQKDIAVHRLTAQNTEVQLLERQRPKFKALAERLAAKVRQYFEEEDKMKYLRSIAHMQA